MFSDRCTKMYFPHRNQSTSAGKCRNYFRHLIPPFWFTSFVYSWWNPCRCWDPISARISSVQQLWIEDRFDIQFKETGSVISSDPFMQRWQFPTCISTCYRQSQMFLIKYLEISVFRIPKLIIFNCELSFQKLLAQFWAFFFLYHCFK